MPRYLIHVFDSRARIMVRYVASESALKDILEIIEREFPGCSINIAPKHKEQQK